MDASEYVIPFVGLKNGTHSFSFQIENTFFKNFGYHNEFETAIFQVHLDFEKKTNMLALCFQGSGHIEVYCDVSTELFKLPISCTFDLIVKFGEQVENSNEEVLYLPVNSYQIDISQYIYEMIVLAIPQKKIHPGVLDGTLQSEIVNKLKELQPKENPLAGTKDPRWDKLNELLK